MFDHLVIRLILIAKYACMFLLNIKGEVLVRNEVWTPPVRKKCLIAEDTQDQQQDRRN